MITFDQALKSTRGQVLVHVSLKDSQGAAKKCRVNGKCKTWTTKPGEFKLPVMYGLRNAFYIDHINANEWSCL